MALTKAEMSEYLFDKLGLSKRDAKELVELFFEEIRRALENGEQVKLSGFGNFVTSICVIRINARDVTRKRARIFPLQHGAW